MPRKLFIFSLFNYSAHWIINYIVPLLVEELTGSAFYTSIVYALGTIPFIFIAPFAGVLGDLFNKKKLIVFLQLLNIFILLGFIIIPFDLNYIKIILFLYCIISVISAFYYPTSQAILPELVGDYQLKNYNSTLYSSYEVIKLLSLLFVGSVLKFGGKKSLLFFALLSNIVSFIFFFKIPYKIKTNLSLKSLKEILSKFKVSFNGGFSYLSKHPQLGSIALLSFFVQFGSTFVTGNLIHYLKFYYHVDSYHISYFFIPVSLGSLLGSLITPYIMDKISIGHFVIYNAIIKALCILMMLITRGPWPTFIILAFISATNSITITTLVTVRQNIVPRYLLSRVVSLMGLGAYIAIPLSSLSSGLLFEYTENFSYLIYIGTGIIVVGIFICTPLLFSKNKSL